METILNSIFEKDIPQQFHDRPMIEELIRSYTIQLEELKQVFYDLDNKTDIDTAEGAVLDDVGSIPVLSRKEAGLLAGIGVEDPVMSDERYRQLLKYKILKNTSECTYADIMTGLEYIYNYKFRYREDERYPAIILLDMPNSSLDEVDKKFYKELCIRGSGIGILASKSFYDFIKIQILFLVKRLQIKNEFYPRLNIPYLKYDGIAKYDGIYRYDKYKTNERIELYPIKLSFKSEILSRTIFLPEIQMKNVFKTLIHTETRLKYRKDTENDIEIERELGIKKDILVLPRYEIKLKIGKHPNRYDGIVRYNGAKQYYVEKEEII